MVRSFEDTQLHQIRIGELQCPHDPATFVTERLLAPSLDGTQVHIDLLTELSRDYQMRCGGDLSLRAWTCSPARAFTQSSHSPGSLC